MAFKTVSKLYCLDLCQIELCVTDLNMFDVVCRVLYYSQTEEAHQ